MEEGSVGEIEARCIAPFKHVEREQMFGYEEIGREKPKTRPAPLKSQSREDDPMPLMSFIEDVNRIPRR